MELQSLFDKPLAVRLGILIITLSPLYFASYQYRIRHTYVGAQSATTTDFDGSASFIRDWLDTQVISPYNPSPLAMYCNRTEWHPNLIFNLDNANGGIGNVRGNVLDFLFFAIEAGASILLPGMAARSQQDLTNVWASRASFETFFDEEWFLGAMKRSCPQMKIYMPEAYRTLATALPGNYLPRGRRMDLDQTYTKQAYLEHLDAWLKSKEEFQADKLTLVNLERTLWEIDTRSLPRGLRRNFGQVLRINPAIRRYAAAVVQNLAAKYNLRLDPHAAVPQQAFFGAHLRTEVDAKKAGWLDDGSLNFTAQSSSYIAQAISRRLHVVYVATGSASDLARFKSKASRHRPPLNVTSKFDLLGKQDATALRKLSWDQQALVDFEVLQRCTAFGGIVKSSFAYHVALARNQRLEDEGRVMEPWSVLHSEVGVGFDDGASRLLGRYEIHEKMVPRGMWP